MSKFFTKKQEAPTAGPNENVSNTRGGILWTKNIWINKTDIQFCLVYLSR